MRIMVTAWLHCGYERPHAEHEWFPYGRRGGYLRCCGTELPQYGTEGNRPLVNIASDVLSVEWSAALYESYAADSEWVEHPSSVRDNDPELISLGRYAEAAHGLAEEIESREWEAMLESGIVADPLIP